MDNLGFSDDIDIENQKKNNKNEQRIYTFNEAVALTGYGKFHIGLLIVCGLCMMSVMTEMMGLSLLMPLAKCDLKFTLSEQGLLASAGFLGNVVSSHAMGFLSDTWGRLKVLRVSIIISAICSIISAFSINVWMLSALRFLVGFFISSCQACNYSYLGEFHGAATKTKNVTLLSTFIPLALVYMPAMFMLIIPLEIDWYIFGIHFSLWRLFILCNAIPGLIALVALPFFPESPRYLLVQGQEKEAIKVLQLVYSKNTGLPAESYPVKNISIDITGSSLSNVSTIKDGLKLIWNQTILLFAKGRRWCTLNLTVHVFIIFGIAQGTFMWFPSILSKVVENYDHDVTVCQAFSSSLPLQITSTNQTAINDDCLFKPDTFMYRVLVIMGVGYTIIYLFFSFVINMVGKKQLLIIWMILAGSCSIALNWSTGFYFNMVMLTLMMAIGNCAGIVNTISMEYFPTNINAMGMCLLVMMGRLGSSAGSNIIGKILEYNCDMLYYGAGILIFLLVSLSGLLPSNKS